MSTDFAFVDRSDPRDLDAIELLGPIVVACRGRSIFQSGRLFESNKHSLIYIIETCFRLILVLTLALVSSVGVASIVFLPIFLLYGHTINTQLLTNIFGLSIIIFSSIFLYLIFRKPRRSRLVLHERGVRYREMTVPLDTIYAIIFGLLHTDASVNLREFSAGPSGLTARSALQYQAISHADGCSWTLILTDGNAIPLKRIEFHVEPEDFSEFLDGLKNRRPELFDWMNEDVSAFDPRVEYPDID